MTGIKESHSVSQFDFSTSVYILREFFKSSHVTRSLHCLKFFFNLKVLKCNLLCTYIIIVFVSVSLDTCVLGKMYSMLTYTS